jgi:hypothetical protein
MRYVYIDPSALRRCYLKRRRQADISSHHRRVDSTDLPLYYPVAATETIDALSELEKTAASFLLMTILAQEGPL